MTGHLPDFAAEDSSFRIECLIRDEASPAIQDRIDTTITRLYDLESADHLSDVEVCVWGSRLRRSNPGAPDRTSRGWERYKAFETWARDTGHDLAPSFQTWCGQTFLHEESWETVVVPIITLAIYDDETDRLRAVVPCTYDDRSRTVEECLVALESAARVDSVPSGGQPENESRPEPGPTVLAEPDRPAT